MSRNLLYLGDLFHTSMMCLALSQLLSNYILFVVTLCSLTVFLPVVLVCSLLIVATVISFLLYHPFTLENEHTCSIIYLICIGNVNDLIFIGWLSQVNYNSGEFFVELCGH